MAPAAKQPCFEVVEGRSEGRVFVLDRVRSYVIGRLPGAEIHIGDHGVSRRHVRVTRHADGTIEAADMRSTNGMLVNDERVERAVLVDGDQISLGPDAVLRLTWRAPDRGAEARALSERQLEVGRLVAAGLTNAAIAEALGIRTRTVTTHLDHIYGRLGIGSRAALTRWLAERGLLERGDD